MRLRFERHFFHQYADLLKFIISRNVATLNILDHDVITLLYCEHWTDKQKYFYVSIVLIYQCLGIGQHLTNVAKYFLKKKQRMRLFLKFASTKMFFSKLTMNSSETPIFKQAKTVPLLCSCLFICCNSDMSLRKTTWLFSLWNLVGHELTVNISISYWIVPL